MMFPRFCLALLALVALASPSLAQGKSEHAPGHGGTPPGQGGTPPGQVNEASSSGKSASGSNAATPAPSGIAPDAPPSPAPTPGNSPSSDRPSSAGSASTPSSASLPASPAAPEAARPPVASIATLSAEQVRSAVENHQAMPLSSFSDVLRQRGGGQMVDASLLRVDNMLVYAIKVLDPAGRLSVEYFHARSGVYIGSE